jgi:uncharacterized protein (DUF697 family)/tellurite resistance protein
MAITDKEAVASLRVLVCVAQADGVLHEEEKKVLQSTFEGIELPDGASLDEFLDETIDLDTQLSKLKSKEAKQQAFQSAYLLAHADGECSDEEQEILDSMQKTLGIDAAEVEAVAALLQHESSEGPPPAFTFIEDPEERRATVQRETFKCSMVCALFGAFPVPGLAIATDLAVVALQINLVREIGQMWGQTVDKESAKGMLATLGVGTGLRLAVSNLLKFFPGWGILAGATTSFASTWAVGRVIDQHFADPKDDLEELKAEFEKAEKEGKKTYKEKKKEIEEKQQETKAAVEALNEERKEGRLTQAEFEERVSMLG